MKFLASIILVAAMLVPAGCEESPTAADGLSPSKTTPPLGESKAILGGPANEAGSPKTIYLIHLQLATVEVPLGLASGSEELWSHLDEEPVSLHSRMLGMNGFRVGLGRQEDWDDIQRTLKKMTGQNFKLVTIQAKAGDVAPIEMQANQPTKLMFITQEDQTLSGEHIFPGDYLLTFTCTLNEDDPSKVMLTVVPQVRSSKLYPRVVHEHGSSAFVNRPVIKTLQSMAFQLTIPNNDFLIIGPGVLARRPTSPGQAFLTKDRKGVPFETVVLLRPMVHVVRMDPASPKKIK